MKFSPNASLLQVRTWLSKHADEGVDCPACGQMVKVYKRKIASGAARGLILFQQQHGTDWGHLPSTSGLSRLGGEFARLALWELVEEEKVRRPDGGRAGYWRVTQRGLLFIAGNFPVPKYAHVYDGKVLKMDASEMVTIKDALGTKFDYAELMAGV